ncbi:MAG: TauD/TfdA family dioxygenase [Streptosporangiaceae bacterium]
MNRTVRLHLKNLRADEADPDAPVFLGGGSRPNKRFRQLCMPFAIYVGDGSALGRDEAEAINDVYDRATAREPWQEGDLLLVDNILCAHGREAFRGDRRIVVAMGDPTPLTACRPLTRPATSASGTENKRGE